MGLDIPDLIQKYQRNRCRKSVPLICRWIPTSGGEFIYVFIYLFKKERSAGDNLKKHRCNIDFHLGSSCVLFVFVLFLSFYFFLLLLINFFFLFFLSLFSVSTEFVSYSVKMLLFSQWVCLPSPPPSPPPASAWIVSLLPDSGFPLSIFRMAAQTTPRNDRVERVGDSSPTFSLWWINLSTLLINSLRWWAHLFTLTREPTNPLSFVRDSAQWQETPQPPPLFPSLPRIRKECRRSK